MNIFEFMFRTVLYFAAVFGVGMMVMMFVITGGFGGKDVALVKEGFSQAYVSGLKGVEQGARHLRGEFCQTGAHRADCG